MQKKYRLKRREDFKKVFRMGCSTANRDFVLYFVKRRSAAPTRVGISISKKVGNAVVRNKIKRRLKEIIRRWIVDMPPFMDLIIIVRKPVRGRGFDEIKSSLAHALIKAKLIKSPKKERP